MIKHKGRVSLILPSIIWLVILLKETGLKWRVSLIQYFHASDNLLHDPAGKRTDGTHDQTEDGRSLIAACYLPFQSFVLYHPTRTRLNAGLITRPKGGSDMPHQRTWHYLIFLIFGKLLFEKVQNSFYWMGPLCPGSWSLLSAQVDIKPRQTEESGRVS